MSWREKIKQKFIDWLLREPKRHDEFPLCDFERIQHELRPCDVLLIEGRGPIGEMIKFITQSPWSHSALYIGRIHDIEDPLLRERIKEYYQGPPEQQLIIESILGKGTIISPLEKYEPLHIRICRPEGLSIRDMRQIIYFAIGRLGLAYGIRHNFDLFRFLLPWRILPRRWGSSLFTHNINEPTKEICSSMIAEAFNSVQFPILPIIKTHQEKGVQFYRRNPMLYTPRDFDYSPYFKIIKYPMFELSEQSVYRRFPWSQDIAQVNGEEDVPSGAPITALPKSSKKKNQEDYNALKDSQS